MTAAEDLLDILVVRQGQRVYGYRNSCPHIGGPLDWVADQFLDLHREYIQCATHAALFRITDGVCVAGPCTGDHLVPVPPAVKDGVVILTVVEGVAAGTVPPGSDVR